ncbi:hypothetical protein DKG74_01595 [Zavarzinia aquatilis]|uniref:Tetratricopeptide repeat protein n=1 Tax=Zavarzinia aquatilis TaxID=2211142 RepID=A0A317EH88_9PROT|nr:hypothetical protein DKG74_01595 [Zavarzinia aquatilis]
MTRSMTSTTSADLGRPGIRAGLFASLLLAAFGLGVPLGGAVAQNAPAGPAAAPEATSPSSLQSLQSLLDRASFWRQHGRPDLAQQLLEQVLSIDPANVEGIYQSGLVAIEAGEEQKAAGFLERLTALAPSDTRVDRLKQSLARGRISPALIEQARAATKAGDAAGAVAFYRQAFAGLPPPLEFAVEYYNALSGTEEGWAEARERLGALARRSPDDKGLQLDYAKALTYREVTRRDGIAMLARLAPTSEEAVRAWRNALLWLNAAPADEVLYRDYLAAHADDKDVADRLTVLTAPMKPDTADRAVSLAYTAVADKRYAEAEKLFLIALGFDANNTSALTGLASLKMNAGRQKEAQDYMDRAVAIDPSLKEQYSDLYRAGAFMSGYGAAQAAARAGRLDEAERLLRPLIGAGYKEQRLAVALMASVKERQRKYAEAEKLYRSVLKARPGDKDATAGLYRVLVAQNRMAEAKALEARVPADLRERMQGSLAAAEADKLRKEAEALAQAGNAAGARQAYNQAVSKLPGDPWLRLSYARFLLRQGDYQGADGLMTLASTGPAPSAEALHAAALYALDRGKPQEAAALLNRIPGPKRTRDIKALADDIALKNTLKAAQLAAASGNRDQAQATFRSLAQRKDLTPAMQGEIANALSELGDKPGALALARRELAKPLPAGAKFGDYAALLGVVAREGNESEIEPLVARLQPLARNDDDRRQLSALRNGLIADRADRARQAGRPQEAYDLLIPALQADPNNEGLQAALARVYSSAGMYGEATAIYDRLLTRAPGDRDLALQAFWAAMGEGDHDRARDLIDPLLDSGWQSSQLYYADGLLARAEGDTGQAIRSLEKAQALRAGELGVSLTDMSIRPGSPGTAPVPATYPPLR